MHRGTENNEAAASWNIHSYKGRCLLYRTIWKLWGTKMAKICTFLDSLQECLPATKHVLFPVVTGSKKLMVSFHCSVRHICPLYPTEGDRGNTMVKVLCYKSKGRWFDLSWCQWIFHWHKILPIALGPGVDSASNINEYQEYFLGVKAAGA